MLWSKTNVFQHVQTAKLLCGIKDETLDFIKRHPQTSELEVQSFILNKFNQHKLRNETTKPIVAFRENTAFVHYYPKVSTNKRLKKNSLILLDIWARVAKKGAPYADITWMAWHGDSPSSEIQKVFKTVTSARDRALKFIKVNLHRPGVLTGKIIDSVAREHIDQFYKGKFLHGTGHELGFHSPHGRGRPINSKNNNPIKSSLAYTIEPGVYLKGKFGVRSEIDFYLSKDKVVITTDVQKKLTLV